MYTAVIPREEWVNFFNSFSCEHHGWLVSMEIFTDEIGAQVEAKNVPLAGIAVDIKGSGANNILITVGEKAGAQVTHTIRNPKQVCLERSNGGCDESLQIESVSGEQTLLRFCGAD